MSAPQKVLLLGGHGKVALKLTPLLLKRSWDVTSVIRNPDHEAEIQALGKGQPGKLSVLVESLDDVKSAADANKVLDKVDPSIVVWSAGAGGKGGPSRTYAVDQDAAKAYITSSLSRSSVKKFLMVSYIASRRGTPPWWNDDDRAAADKVNNEILPHYFKAKVEADEHLLAETERRRKQGDDKFQMINLRPGTLTDDAATGKVNLGKTSARGAVTREDVAIVADALLAREDTKGYFDLLNGDEEVETAVARLVKEGHDGIEGEDLEKIYQRIS
ncbi:putative NAD(P)H-binding protein 1 [Elsinoe fawcettii]|nr:putative NAD(P)H-binding protein 1 [Elsinoe fawcettii]